MKISGNKKNMYTLKDLGRRIVALLAALFLLIPSDLGQMSLAAADEPTLTCTLPEHQHSPECYPLICSQEESEHVEEEVPQFVNAFKPHEHSEACYDAEKNLICDLVEKEYIHQHNEFCYDAEGALACGLDEKKPHEHTAECRDAEGRLICPFVDGLKVQEFITTEDNWYSVTVIHQEGHKHTAACYDMTAEPICGMQEHEHSAECYAAPDVEPAPETDMPPENSGDPAQVTDQDGQDGNAEPIDDENPQPLEVVPDELAQSDDEVADPSLTGNDAADIPAQQQEAISGDGADNQDQTAQPIGSTENGEDGSSGNADLVGEDLNQTGDDQIPQTQADVQQVEGGITEQPADDKQEPEITDQSADDKQEQEITDEPAGDKQEQEPANQPADDKQEPVITDEPADDKQESEITDQPADDEQKEKTADQSDEVGQEEGTPEQSDGDEPAEETPDQVDEDQLPEDNTDPEEEGSLQDGDVKPEGETNSEATGDAEDGNEENEEEPAAFEGQLIFEGSDFTVTATIGQDAAFPAGIELKVREILPGTAEYRLYSGQTDEMLEESWAEKGDFARFFDITFEYEGVAYEPAAFIDVQITFKKDVIPVGEESDLQAIHFAEDGPTVLENTTTDSNEAAVSVEDAVDTISFSADSFSVYGVYQINIRTTKAITSAGKTYLVEVTYPQEAQIPEGSELVAREITDTDPDYEIYKAQVAAALGAPDAEMPGLFDIGIYKDGDKVTIEAPVTVSIRLENGLEQGEQLHVVHFPDGIEGAAEAMAQQEPAAQASSTSQDNSAQNNSASTSSSETGAQTEEPVVATELIDSQVEGQTVTFEASGFSVYALAYTVDNSHYDIQTYIIADGGSITLSNLFGMLDIEEDIAEVVKVEFSNDKYVKVEQIANDWQITSLRPFRTNETLTITLEDERTVRIVITDDTTITSNVTLSINSSSQSITLATGKTGYASFTVEYEHNYDFVFSNLNISNRSYDFFVMDADTYEIVGEIMSTDQSSNTQTFTWKLEEGNYYLGATLTKGTNRTINIVAKRGAHELNDKHRCMYCEYKDAYYIDSDGVLYIQDDSAMSFTSASSASWWSRRNEIKKIVVEDGVTKIPDNFVNGTGYNQLTEVEIAASVTSMGRSAFADRTHLACVTIGVGITSIPECAFSGCTALESINLENVTIIEKEAFKSCKLSNVDFTDVLTKIDESAFASCTSLSSVEIPATVSFIGENAFNGCTSLQTVVFDKDNLITELPCGVFQGCTELESVTLPLDLYKIGDSAFAKCSSLPLIVLPSGLQKIGENAFADCDDLEQAELPRALVIIGNSAFSGCKVLSEQKFPGTLTTIGDEAYKGCESLVTIDIPASVTKLGQGAFSGCIAMEEVSLYKPNLSKISDNLFNGCSALSDIQLPESLTEVGNSAFEGCSALTAIDLTDNIATIGNSAFKNCGSLMTVNGYTKDIAFPDSLTRIGANAFDGCESFESITVSKYVTALGKEAFQNCSNLKRAEIHASIEELPSSLFVNDSQLTYIYFGNCKKIPNAMFKGCTSLTEFEFWEGLEEIGAGAFDGCINLTGGSLPSTLRKIGATAFRDCNLIDPIINFPASLEEIGDSAYLGCTQLTELVFTKGNSNLTIGNKAFSSTDKIPTYLQKVELPDNLTSIGDYAFYSCTSVPFFNLSKSITSIGDYAFYNCNNTQFSPMPKNLETIGQYAFYRCDQITELAFPAGLQSIGRYAFYGNSSSSKLQQVTFAEGSILTFIGDYTFAYQTNLKTIELPDTIEFKDATTASETTSLYVFRGCTGLESVKLPNEISVLPYGFFRDCTSLKSVTIPNSVTKIHGYALYNCSSLKSVSFPNGVTTIGTYALNNCKNLTNVDFPNSLTTINTYAFCNCNQLQEAMLPDTVKTINNYAFSNCTELSTVRIPKSVSALSANAFNGCKSLEKLIWDVPSASLTIPTLEGAVTFTLTLGSHVDSISKERLELLVSRGAENLTFEGANYLNLPATKGLSLPRPLNNLEAGEYFADADGALYLVKENKATLVYVPDDLERYTIPASISGKNEGSAGVPVIGVKNNAFYQAQKLTTLTINSLENMTAVDSYAFAYAHNLCSVNGCTTISEAENLFTQPRGIQLFYETQLTGGETNQAIEGDLVYYSKENIEDVGWNKNVKVTIKENGLSYRANANGDPRDDREPIVKNQDDNTMLVYTGEIVTTEIIISNPDDTPISDGDKIRVYYRFDDGGTLNNREPGEYKAYNQADDSDYITIELVETDVKGVYYYEFDRPTSGKTFTLKTEMIFPNPTSAGGNADIWAEYFPADQVEATKGKARDPKPKHHTVNWGTHRNDFTLTKTFSPDSINTVGVYKTGDKAYVDSQSYVIKLEIAEGPKLEGVGHDNIKSVDFVDTLDLPDGIILNPIIVQEINDNKLIYNGAGTTSMTINSPSCGTIFTFSINSVQNSMPVLSLENNKPCITWRIVNTNPKNPNLDIAAMEISDYELTVTISNQVLQLNEESFETGSSYTIENEVNATKHYCYSADDGVQATAECRVDASGAKLQIEKSGQSARRGEYAPYTIKLISSGVAAVTNQVLTKLKDDIDSNDKMHYIDANGIWEMFTTGMYRDVLTLTINDATLYGGKDTPILKGTKKKVISAEDGITELHTDQENTSYETAYNGTSSKSLNDITKNRFRFWIENNKLCYELKGNNGSFTYSGELNSKSDIQNMFDTYGFFVTRDTLYTVEWNLASQEDLSIAGGASVEITIPTRIKDTFMCLTNDTYYYAYNNESLYRNTAEATIAGESEPLKDTAETRHYQDFDLYKTSTNIESRSYIDELTETNLTIPEVVQYGITTSHYGNGRYDVLPQTDHMKGDQVLLVPVTENMEQPWTEGLQMRTVEGEDYYILNKPDTYNCVWTGNAWADHVKVEVNNGIYDTLMWWYFPDYKGSRIDTLTYKALVYSHDPVHLASAYNIVNETWLGDHEAHRLYAKISSNADYGAEPLVTDWDKKIVDRVGDTSEGETYCNVTKGKQVVYRLRFENDKETKRLFTIKGSQIYDVLPNTNLSTFKWSKENVHLTYVNFECTDGTDWRIVTEGTQQRITWGNNFEMSCINPDGVAYIYVVLDFPDDEAKWENYAQKYGGTILYNTLWFKRNQKDWEDKSVSHDLADHLRLRLQKGVYATGGEIKESTTKDVFNAGEDSRFYYQNNDMMLRKVYYYITVHNDSYTNLYLNPLQDILPYGFTFDKATVMNGNYASVTGEKMNPPSYVKSSTTSYDQSTVARTKTEIIADGRERVTLELKPQYYVSSNTYKDQYNERIGKYYLKPGQAMVIRVDAYTNGIEANTPIIADNIVAMPILDFYGQGADVAGGTSTSVNTGPTAGARKNDGDCELKDTVEVNMLGFNTAGETSITEWLVSHVEVTKGAIRPGIVKSVLTKISKDSDGHEMRVNNPIIADPADKLIWNVTTANSGVSSIIDYAITDVLPSPQQFSGAVQFQQIFNNNAQKELYTLFTILREKGSQSIEFLPNGSPAVQYTTGDDPVCLNIKNNDPRTKDSKEYITIWVKLEKVTEGEKLSIRFVDEEFCIPTGGRVSLNYETENLDNALINKLLINTTYVTPLQQKWNGTANEGNVVNWTTPYDPSVTMSVRNSTQIVASSGGATTSNKKIKQRDNSQNYTDSEKATNWITLPDEEKEFIYTLSVTHNYIEPLSKLVLIDNLPERNDHTVFQSDHPRNSAFKVLFSSNPDFTLTIIRKDTENNVPRGNYRIELSNKTEFGDLDWNGTESEDWKELTDNMTQSEKENLLAQSRSVRLVYTDNATNYNDNLFRENDIMNFSFAARIDPDQEQENIEPGSVAWNGFGYHYVRKGRNTEEEAAPLLVGVRLPDYPSISKRLVNARLKPYTPETEETFTYIVYEGAFISGVPGTNLTREAILKKIEDKKRSYVEVTITVPEGESVSEAAVDLDGRIGNMWNGTAYEEKAWKMTNGSYTVEELPRENYESYSINGSTAKYYTFTYNLSQDETVIPGVNIHDDWSFRLNKTDQFGKPVGGAIFAIYTPVDSEALPSLTIEELNELFRISLLETPAESLTYEEVEYKLMKIAVIPGYGHLQLDELCGSNYLYQELSAPEHYELDDKVYQVRRNSSNPRTLVSVTAENPYRAQGNAILEARKNLFGRSLAEKEFSFLVQGFDLETKKVITDETKLPPMPENTFAQNDSEGKIIFKNIPLTEADIGKTYCYQISEVIPDESERLSNLTYDETKIIAKLTPKDIGDGEVGSTVIYSWFDSVGKEHTLKEAVFYNRYSFNTTVSLNVGKTLTGRPWNENDMFTFVLEGINEDDNRSWTGTIGYSNTEKTNVFTIDYDENYNEKTLYYRLSEIIPDGATAYSISSGLEMSVPRNRFSRLGIPLTYARYKNMEQDEKDQYKLDEEDIFWKYQGLSYDWTAHELSVRLWYDATENTVKTEVKIDEIIWDETKTVLFINRFVPNNTTVTIPVRKKMEGRPLILDDEFWFIIEPDEGAPAIADREIKIERILATDTSQTESFRISYKWDDLKNPDGTYEKEKEFWYTIHEKIDEQNERAVIKRDDEGKVTSYKLDQVSYDLHEERVKVTLRYNENSGTISAEVDFQSAKSESDAVNGEKTELEFTNKYVTERIGFPIQVRKKINNQDAWKGKSFQFALFNSSGNKVAELEIKDGETYTREEEVESGKLGENVWVGNPQTYEYYLKEIIPDNAVAYDTDGNMYGDTSLLYKDANETQKEDTDIIWKLDGMTYDNSRQNITVTVSLNERDYHLKATVKYGNSNKAEEAIFNNGYEAEGSSIVKVQKVIDGRGFLQQGESYTFELTPVDGAPMRTEGENRTILDVTAESAKEIPFGELQFYLSDLPYEGGVRKKVFSYMIHEKVPDDAFVQDGDHKLFYADATPQQKQEYDGKWTTDQSVTYAKDQTISLLVEDKLTGRLNVTYDSGLDEKTGTATVKNTYDATGVASISVKKTIKGREFREDDNFTFELMRVDGAPLRTADGNPDKLIVTVNPTKEGSFDELVYHVEDLDNHNGTWSAKNISYRIHEVIPDDATVLDGENEIVYKLATEKQKAAFDGQWTRQGITYAEDQIVVLRVEDDGKGHLNVTNAESQSVTMNTEDDSEDNLTEKEATVTKEFTNEYEATGTGIIKVEKAINNRHFYENESFTFELTPVDGAPLRTADREPGKLTVTAESTTPVSFDELQFRVADLKGTDSKLFTYRIHEVIPGEAAVFDGKEELLYKDASNKQKKYHEGEWNDQGVVYITMDQEVTLQVTDDGRGRLNVDVSYPDPESEAVKFINDYRAETVTIDLQARKVWKDYKGASFIPDEDMKVIFELFADGEATGQKVELDGITDKNGEISPWTAAWTKLKKYRPDHLDECIVYSVKEMETILPEDSYASYQSDAMQIPVEMTPDEPAQIENEQLTGELEISKKVISEAAEDLYQTFEFVIKLSDPAINHSFETENEGEMISFTDGVSEAIALKSDESKLIKGLPRGIGYTVTEAQNENYLVEQVGAEGVIGETRSGTIFNNTRKTGDLAVSKTIQSEAKINQNAEFEFTVTLTGLKEEAENQTYGDMRFEEGVAVFTLKNGESRKATGLPTGITYRVEEKAVAGYTADEAVKQGIISNEIAKADFINTYTARGETALKAEKQLTGREFLEGDKWTFTVTAKDGIPMPERTEVTIEPTEGSSSTIDFGVIHYTLADAGKTYTYTITETGEVRDVKNDGSKTVTVSVKDLGDGTLQVNSSADEEPLQFVNTWQPPEVTTEPPAEEPVETEFELEGTKTLTGRDFMEGDSWTFTVTAGAGTPMPERTQVTITPEEGSSAEFSFGKIRFGMENAGKTYTYMISESGDVVGVTNDGMKTVNIRVAWDTGKEKLTAYSSTAEEPVVFRNTYWAEGTWTLAARKRLQGREFQEGDAWTFRLTAPEGTPMPERTRITIRPVQGTVTNMTFGTIRYTLADVGQTYTYTITETGEVEGVVNDTVKRVTVRVTDLGDGTLEATEISGANPVFTNVYTDPEATVTLHVRKVWNDNNNELGLRPKSVTVILSNGMMVRLTPENGWSATVENLPAMVDGEPVVYTWTERSVPEYVLTDTQVNGDETVFTNGLWERPELPEGETEAPKMPGRGLVELFDYETPLDAGVMINHVGDCFE